MGFLEGLKDKAGDLGDKAREGLEAAKEKASGLVGDVRERFDSDNTPAGDAPATPTAPRGADDLVGDETYFGQAEFTAPVGPVDDLGAAAAGAAGTTEAADTMSPVDVGAAVSSADLGDRDDSDRGGAPGETPSVGDVAPEASSTDLAGAESYFGEEPVDESDFSADEVSGGLEDSRDDALGGPTEREEISGSPDRP